jgi:hypothetical protein
MSAQSSSVAAARRARDQRKADLIAASAVLRPHAAGAVHDLAGLADRVALRVGQVRAWLADPLLQRTGIALAALLALRRFLRLRAAARRPHRTTRLFAVLTLAWRLGRLVAPWFAAGRARRP